MIAGKWTCSARSTWYLPSGAPSPSTKNRSTVLSTEYNAWSFVRETTSAQEHNDTFCAKSTLLNKLHGLIFIRRSFAANLEHIQHSKAQVEFCAPTECFHSANINAATTAMPTAFEVFGTFFALMLKVARTLGFDATETTLIKLAGTRRYLERTLASTGGIDRGVIAIGVIRGHGKQQEKPK